MTTIILPSLPLLTPFEDNNVSFFVDSRNIKSEKNFSGMFPEHIGEKTKPQSKVICPKSCGRLGTQRGTRPGHSACALFLIKLESSQLVLLSLNSK